MAPAMTRTDGPGSGSGAVELRLSRRPWSTIAAGLFFLFFGLVLLVLPGIDPAPRLFGGPALAAIGALGLFTARRRWLVLELTASHICIKRPGDSFRLPRDAAQAVHISRAMSPYLRPTVYSLSVQLKGRPFQLAFGEHFLSGRRQQALASDLAARLRVPLQDPTGDMLRRHVFPPARWLGQGRNWLLYLFVLGWVSLLTLVAAGVTLLLS